MPNIFYNFIYNHLKISFLNPAINDQLSFFKDLLDCCYSSYIYKKIFLNQRILSKEIRFVSLN